MYTSKNDKHWAIKSRKKQNIRMNPYAEAKIPYLCEMQFV